MPAAHGDLKAPRPGGEVPQGQRGRVRQRRVNAAGQYRGRGSLKHDHGRTPDRIHAAVHAMQTADGDAVLDPLVADAQRAQLSPRDVSVLPRGQAGDGFVGALAPFGFSR